MLEAAGIVESVADHRGHSVARRILLMLLGQDASALLQSIAGNGSALQPKQRPGRPKPGPKNISKTGRLLGQ